MLKAGIIDPTKVVRLALQDAASVAGLIVTTEAMVAEKPEKSRHPRCPTAAAWAIWTSRLLPGAKLSFCGDGHLRAE
jgi:hypothetical protein